MNGQEEIINSKDGEKLLVYDNDDAYLLGEPPDNLFSQEKNKAKENAEIIQKKLLSKFETDLSEEDQQENQENPSLVNKDENNNNESNNKYSNTEANDQNEENSYKEIFNRFNNQINLKPNNNTNEQNKNLMINEISPAKSNESDNGKFENGNEEENNLWGISNINQNERNTHKEKITEKPESDENEDEEKPKSGTHSHNSKKIKNIENKISTDGNEVEESNESEIPLITLNFLSICQSCKNSFNSEENLPYLFKCGHFFCKKCIEEQFIDEEGIKCPNDGLVAHSMSELKILNNFINERSITRRTSLTPGKCCEFHNKLKLSHFIEETKELICIYCAFERYKANPNIHIKELKEKYVDIEKDINTIIEDSQHNAEIIQSLLKEITKNKESESKKVIQIFDNLIQAVNNSRKELLYKIENYFTENAKKLSQKLESLSSIMEKSENIKKKITKSKLSDDNNIFIDLYNNYSKLFKEVYDINNTKLLIKKYRFSTEDESIMTRIIDKFGDFKMSTKKGIFINNLPELSPLENTKLKLYGCNINKHKASLNESSPNIRNTKFGSINSGGNNNNNNNNNKNRNSLSNGTNKTPTKNIIISSHGNEMKNKYCNTQGNNNNINKIGNIHDLKNKRSDFGLCISNINYNNNYQNSHSFIEGNKGSSQKAIAEGEKSKISQNTNNNNSSNKKKNKYSFTPNKIYKVK